MGRNYQKRSPKEYNTFRAIFQWLTCTMVYATFYKIAYGLKIEGRENVPKKGLFIVASNHVSAIDPFLIIHSLRRNIAYMAKVELFQNPVSRFFLNLLGAFAVDRAKLSPSTIKTVRGLKETNWVMGIFPQGTREKGENLENVNKGFASFAKSLKCPILPVAVIGMNKDDRKMFRSKMKIVIGKPIPYNDNIDEMIKTWSSEVHKLTNKKDSEINYAQRKSKDFNILTRLYQYYAMFVLYLPLFGFAFYKLNFKKNKNLPKKPCIIAANHISYMDVFLVNLACNRPLAYMAKQELFNNSSWKRRWVTRNILRLGGFAVNREKVSLSTIKTVKEAFKANFSLCIFPQGGIRKTKSIEDINGGFVYFAKTNKVDIVPVGLSGLETYNWNYFKKQPVDIKVGTPISYELDEKEILRQWSKQISELTGYKNACQE